MFKRGVMLDKKIKLKGYGKINLAIDVIGKLANGYHEVRMIMQSVDLYDEISIEKIDKEIYINTNLEYLPTGSGNICYKAAELMIEKYNLDCGFKINIQKNIPVAAGLAGGSTDGASVMVAINILCNLGLTDEEIMEIAVEIGADVPYCVKCEPMLAEGLGEKLTPIKGLDNQWVLITKPNIGVSTKDVYGNFKFEDVEKRPDIDCIVKGLENGDFVDIVESMENVLESVTFKLHPIVKEIKVKMQEYGAQKSLMSGSGPSVFGIFRSYDKAKKAYKKFKRIYDQTYLVKTVNGRDFNE